MTEPLLLVRNLSVEYRERPLFGHGRRVPAVEGVSLEIARGETLALVGESGSGKSSLAQAIVRLVDVSSGEIRFAGEDLLAARGENLRRLRRGVQIVFQDSATALNPRMLVGDAVAEGLIIHDLVAPGERAGRVAQLLEEVGLDQGLAGRYPRDLSGGQRQRVGIARALAVDPALLICDEPVSALDVSIQSQVLNLLKKLQAEYGLTYLFIAHNLSVVEHISDRIGVMYLGKMAELTSREDLYRNPLHPYTQALLSAIPMPNPRLKRERIVLTGDVPSPLNPPSGCRFHPRCPLAVEVCKQAEPAFEQKAADHWVACHLVPASGVRQ